MQVQLESFFQDGRQGIYLAFAFLFALPQFTCVKCKQIQMQKK